MASSRLETFDEEIGLASGGGCERGFEDDEIGGAGGGVGGRGYDDDDAIRGIRDELRRMNDAIEKTRSEARFLVMFLAFFAWLWGILNA